MRHLGFTWQLPQHRAEAALHLAELAAIGVEVGSALLLVLELRAQILLIGLRFLKQRPIVVPHEHVPADGRNHRKPQDDEEPAHGHRPAAHIAGIESTKLIEEVHFAATFLTAVSPPLSTSTPTTSLGSVKLEPPVGESLAVSTPCSCGVAIHDEPSMLRMKVDTRVLDCATPFISSFLPVSLICVR